MTLARYRVEELIGRGGMGVVWRATDTVLGRTVALKVLPDQLARDPERIARFEREARVLASLNHAHIAAIYGLETEGGVRFLAMEYAPGETLANRLALGAMARGDVLAIALQIAEALENAHERGVIHRDLKPQNIQIGPDGNVKLLDFGLARALSPEGVTPGAADDSPTISAVMTAADVILGTAAYMSPEQARGKLVDRRSDIWAFGVVLFEMLTGRTLFGGDTTSDILADVLRQEVPWDRLPRDTLASVRALLERCLERDPKQRLRDIGEARIALERAIAAPGRSADIPAASARRGHLRSVRAIAALAAAAALGAALAWLAGHGTAPRVPAGAPRRFELASVQDPRAAAPAISPNGQALAYVDDGQLFVRSLDQLQPRSLVRDTDLRRPFWSPDSKWIGFLKGTSIQKVSVEGGSPQTIAEFAHRFGPGGEGATWGEKGTIFASQGRPSGVLQISAAGGDVRPWQAADTTLEGDFHGPSLLPGGRGVLVTAHRKGGGLDNVTLLEGRKRTVLLEVPGQSLESPLYSPTGHIVFERTSSPKGIWAVPFSLARLRTTGAPFLVAAGGTSPSIARDGTLVYLERPRSPLQFAWVDRTGALLDRASTMSEDNVTSGAFDLSPDGTRVVAAGGKSSDLWVFDLARGSRTRLTAEPGMEAAPRFSPDGTRVAYHAKGHQVPGPGEWTILIRNADGSGAVDTVEAKGFLMPAFTPDQRSLVLSRSGDVDRWNLFTVPLAGERRATQLTEGPHLQYGSQVSPDGKLLAYVEGAEGVSGSPEVFLQSFPHSNGRWQVSADGGLWPVWNERGDRLYFVRGEEMMEVSVGPGATPKLGPPTRLFTREPVDLAMVLNWTPQPSLPTCVRHRPPESLV